MHNLTQEQVAAAGPGAGAGVGVWRGHGSEDRIQEIVAFVPDPEQGIEIESRGLIDNDSALETPE